MALKKINLAYEGESNLINAAIEILALRAGYRVLTEAEIEAGQVQESKEDAAKRFVTNFIRATVQQHNAQMATRQAIAQSNVGLDAITAKVEVIEVVSE